MQTIGLIGGMSWESTTSYYQLINQSIKKKLGGLHSAKIILNSVDFAEIEYLQTEGKWDEAAAILIQAAQSVEKAGADFLLICTNTMHKVADQIEKSISIPLLHIADATGKTLIDKNIKTVGLLGTRFTMEQDFYKQRLQEKFGLEVLIPDEADRNEVHRIIYDELCLGIIKNTSKRHYLNIVSSLQEKGAEAIILGCTEISLLIQQGDTSITLYDTTAIHAENSVVTALTPAI